MKIHRTILQWAVMSITVASGLNMTASEPIVMPTDVPPVIAMAAVSDAGKEDLNSTWKIRLSLPKVRWQVVGEVIPKSQWPELKSEVLTTIMTLEMGGPSALAESRILDMKGNDLTRDQVVKRLSKETAVLVSVSGRVPEAYYLQLTNPDTLMVILGPRDGVPVSELLPKEKSLPSQKEKSSRN